MHIVDRSGWRAATGEFKLRYSAFSQRPTTQHSLPTHDHPVRRGGGARGVFEALGVSRAVIPAAVVSNGRSSTPFTPPTLPFATAAAAAADRMLLLGLRGAVGVNMPGKCSSRLCCCSFS